MKSNYEDRTRISLPRRSYIIIRIDGKAFHTYTKGMERPFDMALIEDMNATAAYLCKNIMGAKLAFVQSDEISILITDFEDKNTQAWFDNNIQKMCSISASQATKAFNMARLARATSLEMKWAEFDSRVFQIPQKAEVENYFIWRQQDATRNSIASVAQTLYSSRELHGKNVNEQQEMIFQKGINWNDYPSGCKRGRIILKESYEKESENGQPTTRTRWVSVDTPVFTQERDFLAELIPNNF